MGYMVKVYRSTARGVFSAEDLARIVDVSRRHNGAARVSGMLLFGNDRFLQLLEGPGAAVERTYRRVLGDSRHRDAVMVYEGRSEPLRFMEWPMAFLRAEDVRHLPLIAPLMALADGDEVQPLCAEAALKLFLGLRRELGRQSTAHAAAH